ncbi:short-chain dehydrogenase/reductase SDR [Stutzerimonas stutzeri TS44]|nr:short-chain dehydrogenase/reductase SDR [Stutzerimonas stutzeri TS44]
MQIDLSGKKAIVTGSTDGIGLAIAIGLAKAGASVVLVGREQGRLDATTGAALRVEGGIVESIA